MYALLGILTCSNIFRVKILMLLTDDPATDAQIRGDPFRTLFVARLSYDVKESDLEREFGRFGPIERVRLLEIWFAACVLIFFSDSNYQRFRETKPKETTSRIRIRCV